VPGSPAIVLPAAVSSRGAGAIEHSSHGRPRLAGGGRRCSGGETVPAGHWAASPPGWTGPPGGQRVTGRMAGGPNWPSFGGTVGSQPGGVPPNEAGARQTPRRPRLLSPRITRRRWRAAVCCPPPPPIRAFAVPAAAPAASRFAAGFENRRRPAARLTAVPPAPIVAAGARRCHVLAYG
jgi:hypothetical protein